LPGKRRVFYYISRRENGKSVAVFQHGNIYNRQCFISNPSLTVRYKKGRF